LYRMTYHINVQRTEAIDVSIYELIIALLGSERVEQFLAPYVDSGLVKEKMMGLEEDRLNQNPTISHFKNRIGWYRSDIRENFLERPSMDSGVQIMSEPIEDKMRPRRNRRLSDEVDPWGKYLSNKLSEYLEFHEDPDNEYALTGYIEFNNPAAYPNELIEDVLRCQGVDLEECKSRKCWPKVSVADFENYLCNGIGGNVKGMEKNHRILDFLECFGEDVEQYPMYEGAKGVYYQPGRFWSRLTKNLNDIIDFENKRPIGELAVHLENK